MDRRWWWRGLSLGLFLLGVALAVLGWSLEPAAEREGFVRPTPLGTPLSPAPNSPIASAFGGATPAADASVLPGESVFALPGRWRDSSGAARTWADFTGRPAVIAFIYTSCDETCPTTVAVLDRALAQADVHTARGIAVSFDPQRDDAAALAGFARRLALDGERWTLITPQDRAALASLTTLLGVSVLPMGEEFLHTDVAFALDADGHVRRRLPHPSRDPAALARDVAAALPSM